ncbi:sigma-70 family RNA polymerase sigma factor [Myxococcota bacterium]|nr:sigma-70 family RNA polymerase sigma factor [Myxococcota bacterium]
MIATLSRHASAARRQWSDPRARARLLAGQLIAAERRRVDRLVRDHLHLLPLAGGHAAHFTGLDKDDLAQAAYFGLRRAAETFDPTKGAAFGTHAYWWMRATCQEEVFRMRTTIRTPRRPASPIPKCSSLDLDTDDGSTIGASIADEHADDPAAGLQRDELPRVVAAALGTLAPRDALVVELRFGINGAKEPHTLAEIAERVGMSTEWCRKIVERALGQLRDALADLAV